MPLPGVQLSGTTHPLGQDKRFRCRRGRGNGPRTSSRKPFGGETPLRRPSPSTRALQKKEARRHFSRRARRGLPGLQRRPRSLLFFGPKRRRETAEGVEPLPPADDDFTLPQPQPRLRLPSAPGADGCARRVVSAASTEPAFGKDRPVRGLTEGFVPAGRSMGGVERLGLPRLDGEEGCLLPRCAPEPARLSSSGPAVFENRQPF